MSKSKKKITEPVIIHPGLSRGMTLEEWEKYNRKMQNDMKSFLHNGRPNNTMR